MGTGSEFDGGFEVVNHSNGEFSKGYLSTNTVESNFALLKRRLHRAFYDLCNIKKVLSILTS